MANDRVQAKIDLLKGRDETGEVKQSLEGFGGTLNRIGQIAAGVGLERLAEKMIDLGKSAVSATIGSGLQFEQWKMGFDTMLGSAEKSSKLLSEISEFAKSTPFELKDLVSSSRQLVAYGFAQEEIIDSTRMLGDVAAGVGAPISELVYLYGTLKAQNIAYTKDLNQFTARGIPILDLLAQKFGVNKEQVLDMASKSKIGFKDIQQAFQTMTKEGGIYFNMMDTQAKSVGGVLSNIKDSFTQIGLSMIGFDMDAGSKNFGQLKEGSIFDSLGKGLTTVMELINQNRGTIDGFFNGLVEAGKGFWNILKQIGEHIQTAFTPVMTHLSEVYDKHKERIDKIAYVLGAVLYGAITALIYIIAGAIDILGAWADQVLNVWGPAIDMLFEGITALGQQWTSILTGMRSGFETLVNGVIDGVNKIIEAFNKLTGMDIGKIGKVGVDLKTSAAQTKAPMASYAPAMSYAPALSYTPVQGANYSRNVSIVNNNNFSTSYDPKAFASYQAWQINGR